MGTDFKSVPCSLRFQICPLFAQARVLVARQQLRAAVPVTLGLHDAPAGDRAGLADRAIGGRDQHAVAGIDGPGSLAQRTGEEGIETGIGARIGLRGLAHVDAEGRDETSDQPVLQRTDPAAGEPAGQA